MTLQDAERRYHSSQPHPGESRAWRVTSDNFFWCAACGTTSVRQYDSPADAADAAVEHARTHQEVPR